MAWVHENINDAVSLIEEWLEQPHQRKKFIKQLTELERCNPEDVSFYVEFILEMIDGCTNHVIRKQK